MRFEQSTALNVSSLLAAGVAEVVRNINDPHYFIKKSLQHFGRDLDYFKKFVSDANTYLEVSLRAHRLNPHSSARIPALTHRIWTTSRESPTAPPADYLDTYFATIRALPDETVHYFWTNAPEVRDAVLAKAIACQCRLPAIMDTALFEADPLYDTIFRLIAARKFVLAADILKILILHRYGGIYCDMGISFDTTLFNLIRLSDYALVVTDAAFFQTSFIATAPQSDIFGIFLAVLNTPHAINASLALMGDHAGALDEVHLFSGLGLTACFLLFPPVSARVLIVPPQSQHFSWRSMQSWYGAAAKNGNVLISESRATILNAQEFARADALTERLIKPFGQATVLQQQLRLLIVGIAFFERFVTLFCDLLYFYGTDRAQSWHNYGYIYNHLFSRNRRNVDTILEIYAPPRGAEGVADADAFLRPLRAWQEIFPAARIIGANPTPHDSAGDIHLINLEQDNPASRYALAVQISETPPDLIFDDGMHDFELSRQLLDSLFPWLAPNGFYIIEDVAVSELERWHIYLSGHGYDGVICNIPHSTNTHDNCLIIIHAKRQAS